MVLVVAAVLGVLAGGFLLPAPSTSRRRRPV